MTDISVFDAFPKDFVFGAATAAYQIEGNSFGDCGRSHWDDFAANGGTANNENGSKACAHFLHWENDLDLMAAAGLNAYRFSIAWPRIFPQNSNSINNSGLDFYDRLLDGALAKGLAPHATLYHWDLPDYLARAGGWENPDIANRLADYGVAVHARLGDRLESLATINEPWCVAWLSHFLGHHAPGKKSLSSGVAAMHNVLKAHGRTVSALRAEGAQSLGIVLNMEYSQPASDDPKDQRAAQIFDGIYNRWFISALQNGAYPEDILEHFSDHMPKGWQDDLAEISAPIDWLGLNYYTRSIHADDGTNVFPFAKTVTGPLPKNSMGWELYPEGLRYFLNRLRTEYHVDVPVYVTENGMAWHDALTQSGVNDAERIGYFQVHLDAVARAILDGCDIRGYFLWSLLDNFEWAFGYDERFGVVHVDFETMVRTPKASYAWFKEGLLSRA